MRLELPLTYEILAPDDVACDDFLLCLFWKLSFVFRSYLLMIIVCNVKWHIVVQSELVFAVCEVIDILLFILALWSLSEIVASDVKLYTVVSEHMPYSQWLHCQAFGSPVSLSSQYNYVPWRSFNSSGIPGSFLALEVHWILSLFPVWYNKEWTSSQSIICALSITTFFQPFPCSDEVLLFPALVAKGAFYTLCWSAVWVTIILVGAFYSLCSYSCIVSIWLWCPYSSVVDCRCLCLPSFSGPSALHLRYYIYCVITYSFLFQLSFALIRCILYCFTRIWQFEVDLQCWRRILYWLYPS
jgi:hypothetical protein